MNTNYFSDLIEQNIFKPEESNSLPYEYFIGLSTTTPNVDGTGYTEPLASTGYKRVKKYNSEETFTETDSDGSGNNVANHSNIYFPEATSEWGDITHYLIFDEEVGGNLLSFGEFNSPVEVPENTILSIPPGQLMMSVSNLQPLLSRLDTLETENAKLKAYRIGSGS